MSLCSKCQQNEATVHMTFVFNGVEEEQRHFCKACAPPTGYEGMTVEQIKAMSIIGKKCEFCGEEAFSGVRETSETIYWCRDCGLERSRLTMQLLAEAHPEWKRPTREIRPQGFPADVPAELMEWMTVASRKAVQILRERKKQDG